MDTTEKKYRNLVQGLERLAHDGRFAIAFSGGLDSRFLAHTARQAGLRPLLLHAEGPHMAAGESRFARTWAKANGMDLRLLEADPLTVPEVAANGRMRCYHCKYALFSKLLQEAGDLPLCDGTQASDSEAYRPGVAALKELGILSPLADAGLTKAEIRSIAARTGMELPEQRARPCLMTRFAYLLSPDRASLAALDKAEERIESLLEAFAENNGKSRAPDFRLRRLDRNVTELHLTPFSDAADTSSELPEALKTSLEEAVREATGKPLDGIRILPKLSGFFDKEQAR